MTPCCWRRPSSPWRSATGRADARCASRSSGSWWRRWSVTVGQLAALLGIAATGTASNPVTTAAYAVVPVDRAARDSRAHHGGDPEARPVPDRRHHQPRHQVRPAVGRAHGRLRRASWWGSGRSAGYAGGPVLDGRGGAWRSRCCSSRVRQPGPAAREPARVRAAGHALPGARRLRRRTWPGQLDADVALDRMASVLAGATGAVRVEVWVRVGPRLRPQVDLAARIRPARGRSRSPAARMLPAFDAATRAIAVRHTGRAARRDHHGRSRGTSRCRPPRTSCWTTWPRRRAWCCATSA